ncbi:hypothetical protein B0G75_12529 [Paraburkholderia sp. BL18I3N2]|nr:hypothetical protein B0G75_12529 [Paraburkholderia sp. BL18I3N2]
MTVSRSVTPGFTVSVDGMAFAHEAPAVPT